jgi:hypothetical protein
LSGASRFELNYRAQGPTLDAYISDRSRRCIITGPLGSGKTNASCFRLLSHMVEQSPGADRVRRTRWWAVRNTYGELLTTTAQDWRDAYDDLGVFTLGGVEPPCHDIKFRMEDGTRVECELWFVALDRPDHIRKLRGMQLTGAYLNEVKELARAIVDMVDFRTGRYQPNGVAPDWHGIIGDSNAPDTDHWLYLMAEEERPEGWRFLRQPGGVMRDPNGKWIPNLRAENVSNLPGGIAYYVEGMQGKKDDFIRVNLANEYGYVQDGKPVYIEYQDPIHCREFELHPRSEIYVGLDFGLTPAATISERTPSGAWRTRHEIVTERMGATNFGILVAKRIRELGLVERVTKITGDPSGDAGGQDADESTVFQILEANGVHARPAPTQDPTMRREAISTNMERMVDGEPAYAVHPDCPVLRKGHQGAYCYRRVLVSGMGDRYKDTPDKNRWSHVCEAEQYGALGAGEGRRVVGRQIQGNRAAFADAGPVFD